MSVGALGAALAHGGAPGLEVDLGRGKPGLGGKDVSVDGHPRFAQGTGIVEQPLGALDLRLGDVDAGRGGHRRPIEQTRVMRQLDGCQLL